MSKESDWEKIVAISVFILAVILLFKIIFWLSLAAISIGIIWLAFNFFTDDNDSSMVPLAMIGIGLIAAFISYQVGYGFEQSSLGKPIVDSAKAVVQADNTLDEAEQNLTTQLIDATVKVTNEVSK